MSCSVPDIWTWPTWPPGNPIRNSNRLLTTMTLNQALPPSHQFGVESHKPAAVYPRHPPGPQFTVGVKTNVRKLLCASVPHPVSPSITAHHISASSCPIFPSSPSASRLCSSKPRHSLSFPWPASRLCTSPTESTVHHENRHGHWKIPALWTHDEKMQEFV